MPTHKHPFTTTIISILDDTCEKLGEELLSASPLLQYINIKTKSANKGSKSRAGLANHYAIYVLLEDYVNKGFLDKENYSEYEGAKFSDLLRRQRELPFGSKLQNHALNHRMNQEFKKYFPQEEALPIIRDVKTNRYWINESLIKVDLNGKKLNLAKVVLEIIDAYIKARIDSFNSFFSQCTQLLKIGEQNPDTVIEYIRELLKPNVDARIFEIVSYSILKYHFADKVLYWGWSIDNLQKEYLALYKTGRTNANDGGIDFVMKPLGRFFQVTETVDVGKYFLDIDKVQRFPITFVVKTTDPVNEIHERIREQARGKFRINKIVERYCESIEEIINVPMLVNRFEKIVSNNKLSDVIEEIVNQSRVEFNIEEEGQFGGIIKYE